MRYFEEKQTTHKRRQQYKNKESNAGVVQGQEKTDILAWQNERKH